MCAMKLMVYIMGTCYKNNGLINYYKFQLIDPIYLPRLVNYLCYLCLH